MAVKIKNKNKTVAPLGIVHTNNTFFQEPLVNNTAVVFKNDLYRVRVNFHKSRKPFWLLKYFFSEGLIIKKTKIISSNDRSFHKKWFVSLDLTLNV